jgi:hypothetical protein
MADETKSSKSSQVPYDTESEESFDAKVMSEEMQEGDRNAPNVNVEDDYAASKQFSESGESESKASGSPDRFRDMAKDMKRK